MEEEEVKDNPFLDKIAETDAFKKWNNPANSKLVQTNAFNEEVHKVEFDSSKQDYVDEGVNPFLDQFVNLNSADPYNEHRAYNQPWADKAAGGIERAIVKAGIEVAKMPGIVGGAVMAPFAKKGEGWDTFVNNAYLKSMNELNDKINQDYLPVYMKQSVKDGDIWKQLGSIDMWATDGADAAGFIASMFVPGQLISKMNIGSKLTKYAALSEKISKFQRGLGITPKLLDQRAITAANTIFEASAEAGQAMDSFEKDLKYKLQMDEITQEEYNTLIKQKALLGRDTFMTNVAILARPNALNTRMLYGANKASKLGVRTAEGKMMEEIANPGALKRLGDLGKGVAKAFGREGFYEEGLQGTAEGYLKKQAEAGELTSNPLMDISLVDFGKEYLDMLTTVEGQKAIALGGIMGAPIDIVSDYKKGNRDRKKTNELLKLGRETSEVYLATTLDADIWKRTEEINPATGEHEYEIVNGKRVVDPTKRNELVKKAANADKFGEIFDLAQEVGNSDALTLMQSVAEDNFITPMIKDNEIGLDMIKEFLNENPSITQETKDRIIDKATILQKTQNEFLDFSQPILDLKHKDAKSADVLAWHNMLNNTLLINKSQQIQNKTNLDLVEKQIEEIYRSKGLTQNVDESVTNDIRSTDIRLDKLLGTRERFKMEAEKLKENEALIWNPKKQREAFKEYIEDRVKDQEKETEEKIAKADEKITKIKDAKTSEEVSNVLTDEEAEVIETEEETVKVKKGKKTKEEKIPDTKLDPATEKVIEKVAEERIQEITAQEHVEVADGNTQVAADVANAKAKILDKVRNLENVTVDGTEYVFVEAFGVIVVNTTNNSAAESFTNIESVVEYFEKLLDKNVIAETPQEKAQEQQWEISDVLHTDQEQASTILQEEDKDNDSKNTEKKFPTAPLLGVGRDGTMMKWLPEKFKNWLKSYKDKKGTPVSFSLPEEDTYKYDPLQAEAVRMLKDKDFSNKDFLYRHLPLKVEISKDNFTFITTLKEEVVEAGGERYTARKNIVDAILNNNGNYEGITSKINYQKGGQLNTIAPDHIDGMIIVEENIISDIEEFGKNPKKVPLYFVKDDLGNLYDESGENSDEFYVREGQKGYVYSMLTARNGMKVPIKLNVRKISIQQAFFVYEVYKAMYHFNKASKTSRNAANTKFTDLYTVNTQLKFLMDEYFSKEMGVFKKPTQVTVADFMNVFIYDNIAPDRSLKHYSTVAKGARITFGEEGDYVSFAHESSEFKDAFIDFMTTQKRQNIKLDYLAGVNDNVNKDKYKKYLIEEGVLNVNLDIANPFAGDINVFIDSEVSVKNIKSSDVKDTTSDESFDDDALKLPFNEEIAEKPLNSEKKDVPSPPGSKGGKFGKRNKPNDRPDGFSKTGC